MSVSSISPTSGAPLEAMQAVQQRIATLQNFGASLGFARALSTAGGALTASDDTKAELASTVSDLVDATSGTTTSASTQAISSAISYLGVPYAWGGTTSAGLDCSGLVQLAFRSAGVELPRVAADQAKQGVAVSAADAQPGDLVFFGEPVDHVGIYLGNGQMIDAPHTGAVVRIEAVDLSATSAIRRVTGTASNADWAKALPIQGKALAPAIEAAAKKNGIDPALLASVAWQESGFQTTVSSSAGAQGLMQLMPATAAGLGVDPLNPEQALDGGARYLKVQLERFGGRVDLALAAYNAGPTAVSKAGGVPDYPETQAYVRNVLAHLQTLRGAA